MQGVYIIYGFKLVRVHAVLHVIQLKTTSNSILPFNWSISELSSLRSFKGRFVTKKEKQGFLKFLDHCLIFTFNMPVLFMSQCNIYANIKVAHFATILRYVIYVYTTIKAV